MLIQHYSIVHRRCESKKMNNINCLCLFYLCDSPDCSFSRSCLLVLRSHDFSSLSCCPLLHLVTNIFSSYSWYATDKMLKCLSGPLWHLRIPASRRLIWDKIRCWTNYPKIDLSRLTDPSWSTSQEPLLRFEFIFVFYIWSMAMFRCFMPLALFSLCSSTIIMQYFDYPFHWWLLCINLSVFFSSSLRSSSAFIFFLKNSFFFVSLLHS